MAKKSSFNPIPAAHLDNKELEVILAAAAVRNGEISETAFKLAYGLRPDDAERDLILDSTYRAAAACARITDGENLSDTGNSFRFARQHGGFIRYSHERGQWLHWTDRRWEWDRSGEAVSLAKRTVRTIYGEAEREADKSRREALGDHAKKSESEQKIRAMLNLARNEVAVRLDQLDCHPFLFNCLNGIVHLETGELMPHEPELMLTKISPVEFNPIARCTKFLTFLDEIMAGSESLIEFLQLWFGYCLTSDVREHAVAFFYGQGSNGKSTLLEVITHVMGDYSCMAAPGLLIAKRNEQHPTEIADLFGKRLVVCVETQEGKRFNESIFKWLSGGDRVKGRFMKQDFFEFAATHKFTMAANHKPVVSDSTDSFWRRLKLVPFDVQIPKEKRNKGLPDLLKAERSGILNWLVEGTVKWRKTGLPEPPEIADATDTYRHEQDALGPFLQDCCEMAKDDEAQVGVLYKRYAEWTEENGEKPVSSKRLRAMLKQRGFENYQAGDGKFRWKGLALRP